MTKFGKHRIVNLCRRPLSTVASYFSATPKVREPLVRTYRGGCHCGRVRFEVRAPAPFTLLECNCSICSMAGYLHLVVPVSEFTLLSGASDLTTYRFETKTAEHHFCSVCGIKSFYVPRADPFSRSINARCLDAWPSVQCVVVKFDGRHWGEAARRL